MKDWNAELYLRFEDERTRPSRDLLAQVPLTAPRRAIDLGCGPGNSTELIVERYPDAVVSGVDSSPDMLSKARTRLPACDFSLADLSTWAPPPETDLLFANAVFQWVPNHVAVLARLLDALPPGGCLAVQLPDNLDEPSHALMREIAAEGPWTDRLRDAAGARDVPPPPSGYYDALKPLCRRLDIWHTLYNHPLDGPAAIAEWVKSTGLRPFLDPLDADQQAAYLDIYLARLAEAYPPLCDGKSLLRFPRLFVVAVR